MLLSIFLGSACFLEESKIVKVSGAMLIVLSTFFHNGRVTIMKKSLPYLGYSRDTCNL
ncbi:hypothetical protein [Bacillus cereus group sp. BfR-BA-01382]|uniref:hypothetical protein n=1 Tax=Bacillus cereus group sp. BfR-BA-01382 TaxID=2920326 RepID=UPI001F562C62